MNLQIALSAGPLITHQQLKAVPLVGGIYTAWTDSSNECLYVGKANRLQTRIRSHYSGQRGSDQFCLYVYDRYLRSTVLDLAPESTGNNPTLRANAATRNWIRSNVRFRWAKASTHELAHIETVMRRHFKPILNPLKGEDDR